MTPPEQTSASQSSQDRIMAKTGVSLSMRIKPYPCYIIEIEDVHFNEGAAVLIPQERMIDSEDAQPDSELDFSNDNMKQALEKYHPGLYDIWYNSEFEPGEIAQDEAVIDFSDLNIILSIYEVLKNNNDYKLVIVGHSETGEAESGHQELSEKRAGSLYHLLKGEEDEWWGMIKGFSRTIDMQSVLAYFVHRYGWGCNPGPIDNILGILTKRAVKNFQKTYNKKFNDSIPVDGEINSQTWKAVFNVYMKELADLAGGKDNLGQLRDNLRFVDDAQPTVAYGNKYPISGIGWYKYKSKNDRRLELLFFKTGKEPRVDDIENLVYASESYRLENVELEEKEVQDTGDDESWDEIEIEDIDDEAEPDDELDAADFESECDMDEDTISADDDWDDLLTLDNLPADISDDSADDIPAFH
jgi:peptidoglycan hydrolase-like protein with peptidoglycan-binding domain